MRRRFFVEQFSPDSALLHGEAAEHLGRVLRAEPGQLYELSDGERVWLGRVERVALSKRGESRVEFALVQRIAARKRALQIELLVSLVKFDRFEWCLEKATELGASRIVPLAATRSDKALRAAAIKRWARWEKIVRESAQQARLLHPPALGISREAGRASSDPRSPMAPAKAFAQSTAARKVLLSERREAPAMRDTLRVASTGAPPGSEPGGAALAIGPEGGWTDEEVASARSGGFLEASLGENILRTETAVIAAMAVLQFTLSES